MAIITLTEARRALAERLGGYRLITSGVQVAPPDGTYVGVAAGADAARKIVSTDLTLLDVAGSSSPVESDRWKHAAVYIPSVPIQRQVAEKGTNTARLASDVTDQTLLTTTYVGVLTLAQPLSAALAASLAVEIHSVMAPLPDERGRGLHAVINRTVRNLVFRDRIAITTVADALTYDLSAYPWLTSDSQLIMVSDSETTAGVEPSALRRGGEIRMDGHIPYLVIDAEPSGATFFVDVWRPVGSWVRVSGTWGHSSVGLVNETDAVSVDPDRWLEAAYYYACEALAHAWRNDPKGAYWRSEMTAALPTAARLLVLDRMVQQTPSGRGQARSLNRIPLSGRGSRSWP